MRILLVLLLSFFPVLACAGQDIAPQEGTVTPFTTPGKLTQSDQQATEPSKCPATPSLKTYDYPGRSAIVSANNLIKPAGKAVVAYGQKVYLYGRVLDKNCVPVSDAIVEIWQANPSGRYITSKLDDRMDPYPDFTGSGRAITDNLGRFNFITLFPGIEKEHHAPHIHFLVTHPKFPKVDTEMFFAGDNRNTDDFWLRKLTPAQQNLLFARVSEFEKHTDGVSIQWDVVLDGANDFRSY